MTFQITSLTIVYSTVYSGPDQGPRKTSKLCVTGLCVGNSPVTGEFPTQRASNAEKMFIFDDVIMYSRMLHYIPVLFPVNIIKLFKQKSDPYHILYET